MFSNMTFRSLLRPSFFSNSKLSPYVFWNLRNYCTPHPPSKKEQLKQQAVIVGAEIRRDFQSLSHDFCSCPSPALRHASFAHSLTDIFRIARRYRDPIVLALEIAEKGSRLFMATHRKHAFHYLCYLRLNRPEHSTWHEVMSGLTRMRLYLDLEYYYETNPDILQEAMISEFRRMLARALQNFFQWENPEDRVRIIELDASTDQKFSRHVIVHIEDSDGRQFGFDASPDLISFVNGPIVRALKRDGFFVRPLVDFRESVPLIDLIAYQENAGANFRILGSPKFGRDNVLRCVFDSVNDRDKFGSIGASGASIDEKKSPESIGRSNSTSVPKSVDSSGHPESIDKLDQKHEFGFHDPECPHCQRTFDDSLVNISKMTDHAIEEDLISKKNRDAYLRNIDSSAMDIDRFGIRCTLYYEIDQFNATSKLFEKQILDDLLNDVVKYSRRSEFYEDFSNDEKLYENVRVFKNFKRTLRMDPIDWDSVYGYAGDLLEFFFMASEEAESLSSDSTTASQRDDAYRTGIRKAEVNRRARELKRKYFKLMEQSSSNVGEWEMKKREIIELKKESKLEKLRKCLEAEKNFQHWMSTRLEDLNKRNEIDELVQRAVEMAINHSRIVVEDFERRISYLESANASSRDGADSAVGV